MVANQALTPVTIGAIAGLIGAVAAGKGMGRLLFQVEGYDPVALLSSLVVLAFVALLAADGPARRASRTNPVSALGSE